MRSANRNRRTRPNRCFEYPAEPILNIYSRFSKGSFRTLVSFGSRGSRRAYQHTVHQYIVAILGVAENRYCEKGLQSASEVILSGNRYETEKCAIHQLPRGCRMPHGLVRNALQLLTSS